MRLKRISHLRRSIVISLISVSSMLVLGLVWLWRRRTALVNDVVVRSGTSQEHPIEIPLEAQGGDPPLQMTSDGHGPLFHRRYRIDIQHTQVHPGILMQRIKTDIQDFCPITLAKFTKIKGDPTLLRVGDEYNIELLAPWNGKVRVIDVQARSFTFITLAGHPEAGEIRFRLIDSPENPGTLRFEILSWARSRDKMVDFSYRIGNIGSAIQKNAWIEFCRRVLEASGGQRVGRIDVLTEEREFEHEVVPHE